MTWKGVSPILIVVILAIAACIVGYWTIFTTTRYELVVADAQQVNFGILYVADKKGYLKDEGITLKYRKFNVGKDALADMLQKNSQLATVFETPTMHAIYQGKDLAILTTLHSSNRNMVLMAKTDQGITKPADLKGKTIAVPLQTNAEFFLYLYLTGQGLTASDINLQETKPEELSTVLDSPDVDAATLWGIHVAEANRKYGPEKLLNFHSDLYTEMSLLTVDAQYAKQHKEVILRLMKALVRAEAYMRRNPEESLDIIAEHLSPVSREIVEASARDVVMELKLDNTLMKILNREALWFRNAGVYSTEVPSFREKIMTEFLDEVKPSGVTL